MSDYADWTESMELLGSEIMVPMDLQGSYIMMPIDIQAQYINLAVDIVAQTVGNIAIDISAQTIGNLNVNIAASAVTLNVNISSQTGNINVNIAAQAGNVTINVAAQTVAIKSQGEWSPQQNEQKYFTGGGTNKGYGAYFEDQYTVSSGKALYITFVTFSIQASAVANADLNQHGEVRLWRTGQSAYLMYLGGEGGGGQNLETPIKIPGGQTLHIELWSWANHNCDLYYTLGGYEI